MAAQDISVKSPTWPFWEQLFYKGERLRAEVSLLASGFLGNTDKSQVAAGCAQIHRSWSKPSQTGAELVHYLPKLFRTKSSSDA